jgi:hypothetical protein
VLPLPAVSRWESYRLDASGTAILGEGFSVPLDRRARLGEVYLRLSALDLDDPDAILDFAHRQGVPNGASVYAALERSLAFTSSFTPAAGSTVRATVLEAEPESRRVNEITTLESFAFAARCFRDLLTAWRVVRGERVEASAHSWELALRGEAERPLDSGYTPELTALLLLTDGLTGLLAHITPFVLPTPTPDDLLLEDEPSEYVAPAPLVVKGADIEIPRKRGSSSLTELCALELFNHIAENATYRTCENESCLRPFVRQYGRAEHGQSRLSGIKFCSYACAQAQTQRTYRRRRQARRADRHRDASAGETRGVTGSSPPRKGP